MYTVHDGVPELARLPRLRTSQIKGLLGRAACIRWRVVLLRAKGEILGTIEPPTCGGQGGAAVQFERDEVQRNRIMVQELPG
jgi:hypothetical protein